ncbi:plasmid mobilization protein [Lichenifustis flavocetrariae]|uniref:Mobilization protein n=1 Tax=Lichenifustis flavocetrariae TaxID=2949735 RepID=A0AA41Z2I4_9HYPH|nr:hypothetical protein [Lichenifustis flavocetrariae]MCW6513026.1 hypothetical protein [Lichenifustis flavocetrariae]
MPGRPRKTHLDVRASPVTVRFRIDEAHQLDLFAKAADMTASEYIRACALKDRPPAGISAALKHRVFRALLAVQTGIRSGDPADVLTAKMQAVIDELRE